MTSLARRAAIALAFGALTIPSVSNAGSATRSIAVPGDGGWDYASVDAVRHRLYIAHGDEVAIVDLATRRPLAPLGPVAHAHGVVPLSTGEVAVTSGADNSVRFFAAKTGRQIASVAVGNKPDAAIVDPATGHLLSMDADSGVVSDIDVVAHRVTRTITVAKGLEYATVAGRTLFINNEDRSELEVVDLDRGVTEKPIALPGCEGPTGLALDRPHHRLVSACANGVAAIVDILARRLVQRVPIGHGPDAVIIDPRRALAFIPAGKDGVLDILSLAAPDTVVHKATVRTETGARTGALDPGTGPGTGPSTGIVWLPVARLLPAVEGAKPKPVPGTFHILGIHPS